MGRDGFAVISFMERGWLGSSSPSGFPCFVFRWSYPVAGEVSLVDGGEGFFGGGDEAFAVGFDDGMYRPLTQAGDGIAPVAAGTDDFRHLLGDGLAV